MTPAFGVGDHVVLKRPGVFRALFADTAVVEPFVDRVGVVTELAGDSLDVAYSATEDLNWPARDFRLATRHEIASMHEQRERTNLDQWRHAKP